MALISMFGEMWARNRENIAAIPGSKEGGYGVYVLYDGSMPLYVGRGNIRSRIRGADRSERRGRQWDYFSWYAMTDRNAVHDLEVVLLLTLPFYLRIFTRQTGKFLEAKRHLQKNERPVEVRKIKAFGKKG